MRPGIATLWHGGRMHGLILLAVLAAAAVPGWHRIPVPEEGSDLLWCGNYSTTSVVVSHDGTVGDPLDAGTDLSPAPWPFDASALDLGTGGRRSVHAVTDGWL